MFADCGFIFSVSDRINKMYEMYELFDMLPLATVQTYIGFWCEMKLWVCSTGPVVPCEVDCRVYLSMLSKILHCREQRRSVQIEP